MSSFHNSQDTIFGIFPILLIESDIVSLETEGKSLDKNSMRTAYQNWIKTIVELAY